jgi:hypothetical protein
MRVRVYVCEVSCDLFVLAFTRCWLSLSPTAAGSQAQEEACPPACLRMNEA